MVDDKSNEGRSNDIGGSGRLYEVRVVGQASAALAKDLGTVRASETTTGLVFEIPDQAALQGLLRRIESLGLEIVSVNKTS